MFKEEKDIKSNFWLAENEETTEILFVLRIKMEVMELSIHFFKIQNNNGGDHKRLRLTDIKRTPSREKRKQKREIIKYKEPGYVT